MKRRPWGVSYLKKQVTGEQTSLKTNARWPMTPVTPYFSLLGEKLLLMQTHTTPRENWKQCVMTSLNLPPGRAWDGTDDPSRNDAKTSRQLTRFGRLGRLVGTSFYM